MSSDTTWNFFLADFRDVDLDDVHKQMDYDVDGCDLDICVLEKHLRKGIKTNYRIRLSPGRENY